MNAYYFRLILTERKRIIFSKVYDSITDFLPAITEGAKFNGFGQLEIQYCYVSGETQSLETLLGVDSKAIEQLMRVE